MRCAENANVIATKTAWSMRKSGVIFPAAAAVLTALLATGCGKPQELAATDVVQPGEVEPVVCVTCGDLGKLSPRSRAMQQARTNNGNTAEQAAVPGETPPGMVLIPAGEYVLSDEVAHTTLSPLARRGFNRPPVYTYKTPAFWIDAHEVSNRQFKQFVDATGYITTAEKAFDPADFPGLTPRQLAEVKANFKPGAVVFTPPDHPVRLDTNNQFMQWWSFVPGASWKHPAGPGSSIADRMDHPVVNVSWHDAQAYARWAGKQLPNTHQWEIAARGGLVGKEFTWGDAPLGEGGNYQANIWQGAFPHANSKADGFAGTAPVGSFAANDFGIYDMAGNVWEWVQDLAPNYPPGSQYRLQRGGSYLCSDVYCAAFRPAHSAGVDPYTGLSHTGFRCIRIVP